MSNRIYLADKETQDEIKQDTSQISSKASQTSVDNVRNDTQFIRNEFPTTVYSTKIFNIQSHLAGSLTGKGVIYQVHVRHSGSSARYYHIQIDGRSLEGWWGDNDSTREFYLPFSSAVRIYSESTSATATFIYGR